MHRAAIRHVFSLSLVLLLVVGLAGCSSDSPSNNGPTAPGPGVGNSPGAQVAGQVTSGGTPGMTVTVRGAGMQTVLDANGAFAFSSVPPGDQVLLFATAAGDAALGIPGVRDNEQIDLTVRLQGATATLESIDRQVTDGEGGEEEEGEGPVVDVFLQVSPDTWNTNWVHSSGTVQIFLRGPDFRLIDLDSIELIGDDPDAEPVLPVNTRATGNHVLARFAKSEAFESLLDPEPGDVVEIVVRFSAEVDGEVVEEERVGEVRIVGPGDEEGEDGEDGEGEVDLTLQVSPSNWNTNWPRSSGTVQVFFRGPGYDRIDLDSIELIGDDPDASPLAPQTTRLAGNHVLAHFGKADAFATLDEPESGEFHEITLRLTVDGEEQELVHEVRIVGP